MARGTAAGLLESPGPHPQSQFKHEILRQYLDPFAGMTGSQNSAGRLVILDGYAGIGRYPSGEPASAELIMKTAQRFKKRKVQPFFIEAHRPRFVSLQAVVAEYAAKGVEATAKQGKVEDHLDAVVQMATNVPLFMFLDPCGAVVPFDTLASILTGPRRSSRPATEVLLNFSADFTRRTAGALRAGQTEHEGIPVLDRTCGGTWWREVALDAVGQATDTTFEPAALAVVTDYAARLGEAARSRPMVIPVRKRQHHQPTYHLVFLTRSPYGEWVFGVSVAKARKVWLRAQAPEPDDVSDEGALFDTGDLTETVIDHDAKRAQLTVEANLTELLTKHQALELVQNVAGVFNGVYGLATEEVVMGAVRTLEQRKVLTLRRPVPKRIRNWIIERPSPGR